MNARVSIYRLAALCRSRGTGMMVNPFPPVKHLCASSAVATGNNNNNNNTSDKWCIQVEVHTLWKQNEIPFYEYIPGSLRNSRYPILGTWYGLICANFVLFLWLFFKSEIWIYWIPKKPFWIMVSSIEFAKYSNLTAAYTKMTSNFALFHFFNTKNHLEEEVSSKIYIL